MPPAFNLSQDQTLQFNLANFLPVLADQQISLKANLLFVSSISCEVLLLCLEFDSSRLGEIHLPPVQVPTLIGCFFYLLKNFAAAFFAASAAKRCALYRAKDFRQLIFCTILSVWLRGQDLNLRPSGYEPDELPDCSTPQSSRAIYAVARPISIHWDSVGGYFSRVAGRRQPVGFRSYRQVPRIAGS